MELVNNKIFFSPSITHTGSLCLTMICADANKGIFKTTTNAAKALTQNFERIILFWIAGNGCFSLLV